MTDNWFVEMLRFTAIVLAGVAMTISLLVAVRYEKAYQDVKKTDGDWKGLLPRHVRSISFAHAASLAILAYEVAIRLGEDLTWRSPALIGVASLTLYALADMVRYRVLKVKTKIEVLKVVTTEIQEDGN